MVCGYFRIFTFLLIFLFFQTQLLCASEKVCIRALSPGNLVTMEFWYPPVEAKGVLPSLFQNGKLFVYLLEKSPTFKKTILYFLRMKGESVFDGEAQKKINDTLLYTRVLKVLFQDMKAPPLMDSALAIQGTVGDALAPSYTVENTILPSDAFMADAEKKLKSYSLKRDIALSWVMASAIKAEPLFFDSLVIKSSALGEDKVIANDDGFEINSSKGAGYFKIPFPLLPSGSLLPDRVIDQLDGMKSIFNDFEEAFNHLKELLLNKHTANEEFPDAQLTDAQIYHKGVQLKEKLDYNEEVLRIYNEQYLPALRAVVVAMANLKFNCELGNVGYNPILNSLVIAQIKKISRWLIFTPDLEIQGDIASLQLVKQGSTTEAHETRAMLSNLINTSN